MGWEGEALPSRAGRLPVRARRPLPRRAVWPNTRHGRGRGRHIVWPRQRARPLAHAHPSGASFPARAARDGPRLGPCRGSRRLVALHFTSLDWIPLIA